MKKILSFCVCVALVCCFVFSGCASLNLNNFEFSKYSSEISQNEILKIETKNLSTQEKKTKIAEEYIKISFTVIIAKEVRTTIVQSGATVSDDTEETFVSFGSGTVVYKGGYILTNYHVVANALLEANVSTSTNKYTGQTTTVSTSYKTYVSQDGGETAYEAVVLWSNINFDLAIIMCKQFENLPAAQLKDRSVYCNDEDRIKVLEEVITIGTQYDEENYGSATLGTISSSKNRSVFGTDIGVNYEYLIQHNASINHGNSGGALVDLDGNLIGVNTLGVDNANSLFYAVSVYPIIEIIDTVVYNWEQNGAQTTDQSFGLSGIDKLLIKNAKSSVEAKYAEFDDSGVIVTDVTSQCIIKNIKVGDIIKIGRASCRERV